ncbi:MAG: HD-GYP domain-containing protein [Erysipelotrichaceae bacterium]
MKLETLPFILGISDALDFMESELLQRKPHHGKRVAYLSYQLATRLACSEAECQDLLIWALFHDIALLEAHEEQNNATPLLQSHSVKGEAILAQVPFITGQKNIIRYHHEHWDGSGAFGLSGKQIPLAAQIIKLCDRIEILTKLCAGKITNLDEIIATLLAEQAYYQPELLAICISYLKESTVQFAPDDQLLSIFHKMFESKWMDLPESQILRLFEIFADIIDYKSHSTKHHSISVAAMAHEIGVHVGFDDDDLFQFQVAAYLHDFGKLFTPVEILEKPGKLTTDEFEVMKQHVVLSRNFLSQFQAFEKAAVWAGNHHETLSGTGYPHQLQADQLDLASRWLAIIDIYKALSEKRVYHEARSKAEVFEILTALAQRGALDLDLCQQLYTLQKTNTSHYS